MTLIQTLEGAGEVSLQGGAPVGPCSYRIDVYQEELRTDHLRGRGSVPGMQRWEIRDIALRSGDMLPRNTELVLLLSESKRVKFVVQGDGTFDVMGLGL